MLFGLADFGCVAVVYSGAAVVAEVELWLLSMQGFCMKSNLSLILPSVSFRKMPHEQPPFF